MKRIPAVLLLKKLLLGNTSGRRLWTALFALCLGLFLLLSSVLLWWNFNYLLSGNASGRSMDGSYLMISRRVTNENMGLPGQTVFNPAEIEVLRHAPQVEDLGEVKPLKPQAYMRLQLGPGMGFSTVLVLESVPDRFIENLPANWEWSPGSRHVPVILSSSFLSLYNYAYAPSQGLPQLSESSIQSIPFSLEIGQGGHGQNFVAQVAGFSNRINSVLAPESFIQEMNQQEAGTTTGISRVMIKVKDPTNAAFTSFLKEHDYMTNSELGRWSQLRILVQSVVFFVGVLALLLLLVSVLVFVLFIELSVSRAKASVVLLQEIGFSPALLRRFLQLRFFRLISLFVGIAVALCVFSQFVFSLFGKSVGLHFLPIPGWPFWSCVLLISFLLFFQIRLSITAAIKRI